MKESWAKLKEWWFNLALREKQALILGMSLLQIFIVYQFIWLPCTNHVSTMRARILKDQKILTWMRAADKEIAKVEGQSKSKSKVVSPVVLLDLLQKQINSAGLEQYLSQLKQANNEAIEMHFQKVDFDKMVRLLTTISKEQHISIIQMSVLAESTPGKVNAEVILKLE